MQTIVCQTAESFSPELTPQVQSLQKPREDSSPRQGGFLAMLNEALQKESPAPEKPAAVQEEGAAEPKEAELSYSRGQEKVEKDERDGDKIAAGEKAQQPAKKDEAKKVAKKEGESKTGRQNVDAFIAGALEARVEKKPAADGSKNKPVVQAAAKKSAAVARAETNQIDPKQLEFLRKLSQSQEAKAKVEGGESRKGLLENELSFADLASQEGLLLQEEAAQIQAGDVLAQDGGQASNGALDASKALSAKKDSKKPVIQVTDLRTKTEPAAAQKSLDKDARKNFSVSVKEVSKGSVEMTLDLSGQQAEKNIMSLDGQSAAADGSTFQAMLKNQIAQNAGDFVRAGNIVLRDGDQGQINLILHPEGLGNVKITMEVSGKDLTGHITVNSREAMEAFGQNADALREAFIQSGFEDATFDVSFAGSQMNFARGDAQNDADERARQGRKIYGEFTQESLTSIGEVSDNFIDDDVSVNIVA